MCVFHVMLYNIVMFMIFNVGGKFNVIFDEVICDLDGWMLFG